MKTTTKLCSLRRSPRRIGCALVCIATISIYGSASGEIHKTKVGNPNWELADEFMAAVDDVYNFEATYTQDGNAFVSSAFGDTYVADRQLGQLYPSGPTHSNDFRRAIAAAGGFDSNAFVVSDVDDPNVVLRGATVIPSSNKYTGSSINGADTPIIDPDVFPITASWAKEFQNGVDLGVDDPSNCIECGPRQVDALSAVGVIIDEMGQQRDYSDQNWTHIPFWTEMNWLFDIAATRGAGKYRALVEYRDVDGNGWDVWHDYSVVRSATRPVGDLSYDQKLDIRDVNIVSKNVALGSTDKRLDLNEDNVVDVNDLHFLATDLMDTAVGDANLDGEVNFTDFLTLSDNFEQAGGWGQGDFNANERVDFGDFLLLSENFGTTSGQAAAASVPEPKGGYLAAVAALGLLGLRQRSSCESDQP